MFVSEAGTNIGLTNRAPSESSVRVASSISGKPETAALTTIPAMSPAFVAVGGLSETRHAGGGLPHTRRAGGGATGLIRSTGRGGRAAVEGGRRLRQTCIGDGFTGGDDGELGGPGRAFEVLELQMFGRVETFDLGGDPCGERARVEMSDGSDSAPAVDQAVPRLISGV